MHFSFENLFVKLDTILKSETTDKLLQALSELPIHEGCDVITLRRCYITAEGIPLLEPQAYWSNGDVAVWQQAVTTDDESMAAVWILSAGPPIFIEDFAEFALFTNSSRDFYLQQGITSLYRILVKRNGQVTGMLTVMWTTPRTFSAEYKATIEFLGWVLLPVLENIHTRWENQELTRTIAQLEQKLQETEGRIHALAHDLKQPLTSIVTTASLLSNYVDRLNKDQISAKLDRVLQASKGMSDWISSILLLAQARSTQTIELVSVKVRETLWAAADTMREQISKTSAQLDIDAVDESIEVCGQPIWITHIWINLISNACKYAGPAPLIIVTVEVRQDTVYLAIHDSGQGIPQDKLSLVFEPFSRFSSEASGTGIGLTTVKMLVEKMGGEIGVESDATGTTFWFTLKKGICSEQG